jgi:hypothetical protein
MLDILNVDNPISLLNPINLKFNVPFHKLHNLMAFTSNVGQDNELKFQAIMNIISELVASNKLKLKKDDIINRTLRMTISELMIK